MVSLLGWPHFIRLRYMNSDSITYDAAIAALKRASKPTGETFFGMQIMVVPDGVLPKGTVVMVGEPVRKEDGSPNCVVVEGLNPS